MENTEREKSVVESKHWFTIHVSIVFFSDVILLFTIHLLLKDRCNDSRKRKTMNYDSLKWIAQKNRCHFRKKTDSTITEKRNFNLLIHLVELFRWALFFVKFHKKKKTMLHWAEVFWEMLSQISKENNLIVAYKKTKERLDFS